MFNIVTSIILALISLAIIGWIFYLVFRAVFGSNPGAILTKWNAKRAYLALTQVDKLIEEEKTQEALSALRDNIWFDAGYLPLSAEFPSQMLGHNMSLLGRCAVMAQKMELHPQQLITLEELFQSRAELFKEVIVFKAQRSKIYKYRKDQKKEMPEWGVKELQNKAKIINEKLSNNLNAIKSEFNGLIEEFTNSARSGNITYH